MRTLFIGVMLSAGLLQAAENGVVRTDSGTGFIVDGNLLVTALHCAESDTINIGGVKGTIAYRQQMLPDSSDENILADGVAVYRLSGGPYKSLNLAKRLSDGESVRSVGFAGGQYNEKVGKIRGGDGTHYNQTSFVAQPGDSGGPVLNRRGEVVGVVLASNPSDGTVVVGLNQTRRAVETARTLTAVSVQREVVIFTTPGCRPCEQLKTDIQLGFYKKFKLRQVEYRSGVWSDNDLYREFIAQRDPNGDKPGFPVIWVRGTPSYKAGYSSGRRGGLISFIGGVLDKLASVVVGDRAPTPFPIDDVPGGFKVDVPPPAPAEVESDIDNVKSDIDDLRNGNVLEKLAALKSLRGDVEKLKSTSSAAMDKAAADKAEIAAELADKVADLKENIEGVRSGNPFLKARSALALKKELPDTIALAKNVAAGVKTDLDGVTSLRPEALIGLAGLIRAVVRRRREDSDADLLEVAA
tara:strand:- start:982 stop:2385 length:1404 start_codon:yes stop_codon:yes gene_type:complete